MNQKNTLIISSIITASLLTGYVAIRISNIKKEYKNSSFEIKEKPILPTFETMYNLHLEPINKKKNTKLDSILTYERLRKRVEVNNDDTNLLRRNRKIGFIIASIISLLCMILPCRYIFTPSNFTGVDSNKDVLGLVLNILPFVIISFISFIGYSIYFYKNINLEIKILLEKQKENKKDPKDNKESFFDSSLFINIVRGVILVTGITFVVLGIFNKGFEDVLIKAINICSECIGLA
jgi:hypothetical protein